MENISFRKFSMRIMFILTLVAPSLAAQQIIPPPKQLPAPSRLLLVAAAPQEHEHPQSSDAMANSSGGDRKSVV